MHGLDRCRRFLKAKNPLAAERASQEIRRCLQRLASMPEMGRPYADEPRLRELIIEFGDSGYLAQYFYDPGQNEVVITAFRHQREATY